MHSISGAEPLDDGAAEGLTLGDVLGITVGLAVGVALGLAVGLDVGDVVGAVVLAVGLAVGSDVAHEQSSPKDMHEDLAVPNTTHLVQPNDRAGSQVGDKDGLTVVHEDEDENAMPPAIARELHSLCRSLAAYSSRAKTSTGTKDAIENRAHRPSRVTCCLRLV